MSFEDYKKASRKLSMGLRSGEIWKNEDSDFFSVGIDLQVPGSTTKKHYNFITIYAESREEGEALRDLILEKLNQTITLDF